MAAVDYFLKIDGIKGESQDKNHKDEIDVTSFSWGMAQQGTASKGGGMGAGKIAVTDMRIVKEVDAASPKLFDACFTGKHIPTAQITCRKAGGSAIEYWIVKFTDLLISSVHQQPVDMTIGSASTGGGGGKALVPEEVITINYSAYEASYKGQQSDGTASGAVTSKGNVKTNAAG